MMNIEDFISKKIRHSNQIEQAKQKVVQKKIERNDKPRSYELTIIRRILKGVPKDEFDQVLLSKAIERGFVFLFDNGNLGVTAKGIENLNNKKTKR